MKLEILCVFLCCLYTPIFAENLQRVAGARAIGMGESSVALEDEFAAINNQAILPLITKKIIGGIDYRNLHEMSDLSVKSGFVIIPFKWGVFSTMVQEYGVSKYTEMKIGLAYSRAFGNRLSFSLQADYMQIALISSEGTKSNLSFEAGAFYVPLRGVKIGMHVFNPSGTVIRSEKKSFEIPSCIRLGVTYTVNKEWIASAEFELVGEDYFYAKAGLEYIFKKHFFIRGGFYFDPLIYTAGCGIQWKKFKMDFGFSHHPILSLSSDISLIFTL